MYMVTCLKSDMMNNDEKLFKDSIRSICERIAEESVSTGGVSVTCNKVRGFDNFPVVDVKDVYEERRKLLMDRNFRRSLAFNSVSGARGHGDLALNLDPLSLLGVRGHINADGSLVVDSMGLSNGGVYTADEIIKAIKMAEDIIKQNPHAVIKGLVRWEDGVVSLVHTD